MTTIDFIMMLADFLIADLDQFRLAKLQREISGSLHAYPVATQPHQM
jgi:hypothetical protein